MNPDSAVKAKTCAERDVNLEERRHRNVEFQSRFGHLALLTMSESMAHPPAMSEPRLEAQSHCLILALLQLQMIILEIMLNCGIRD